MCRKTSYDLVWLLFTANIKYENEPKLSWFLLFVRETKMKLLCENKPKFININMYSRTKWNFVAVCVELFQMRNAKARNL